MTGKKKVLIAAGALVLLAVIIGFSVSANRGDTVSVETAEVTRQRELVAIVSATGEIQPKEFVEIQSEIAGVVTELRFQEGDFVNRGEVILKIDPVQTESELRAQQALLESALAESRNQLAQIAVQETNVGRDRAAVRVAEAELKRARQALILAQANFDRRQQMFEDNLISRDVYEAARNDLVGAESALDTAEARLEQADAQLEVAKVVLEQARNSLESAESRVEQQRALLSRNQDLLSKTVIRAPLAGVITSMAVEVGERAVPGTLNNPAATLMVIADLSVIEAEIEVDETDIVEVETGQLAVVTVDALPDQSLEGQVTEIGNSAIATAGQAQEARDFKVVIRLEDPSKSLRPGMSCTAEITTATVKDVIAIPIQALAVREFPVDSSGEIILESPADAQGKGEGDQDYRELEGVFLVRDGKAAFTPVTTGVMSESEIQVVSGLEAGDRLITGSYKALRELAHGDAVEIEGE